MVLIKRLSFLGDYLLLMHEVQIRQTELIKGLDFHSFIGSAVVFELDFPTQALLRRLVLGNGVLHWVSLSYTETGRYNGYIGGI